MRTKTIAIITTALLVVAACGNDTDDTAVGSGPEELPEPVCIVEGEPMLEEYLGLSEAEATEQAETDGYSVRVVGVDGECFAVTMDLRDDRVNLELADEVVIGAAIY